VKTMDGRRARHWTSLTIDQVPASDGGDMGGTALLAAVFAQVVLLIVRKPPPASR
jgi:hypothetical protein